MLVLFYTHPASTMNYYRTKKIQSLKLLPTYLVIFQFDLQDLLWISCSVSFT